MAGTEGSSGNAGEVRGREGWAASLGRKARVGRWPANGHGVLIELELGLHKLI